MSEKIKVIGVHPIITERSPTSGGREPVHLIEVEIAELNGFEWGDVTQVSSELPRADWQAVYDEQELSGGKPSRYCFFFHYLDFLMPLETSFGPVILPDETPVPDHLRHIEYEEPQLKLIRAHSRDSRANHFLLTD